ncbi:MAG: bifunctional UDP-N-acetylglucosamine diphosphorylase/glucosamine-1-phosphate N-acetyltransferase GlmU [Elusimicrobiota bacterium]|jgi:bifunctional UDP-N-acetylglucosamine pyrophosphorylase/glucosamine-1-phosphate N-acetyltransferase
MKTLYVLVLAAGQGTRMKSATPKVIHEMAGKPLLEHVLHAVRALHPKAIGVVLGLGREKVQSVLEERGWDKLGYIVQSRQLGSGHAVRMAQPWLKSKKGTLLVVYGDTPLLTTATLQRLVEQHADSGHAATFLAMDIPNPSGYGRMVLDPQGFLERIVEDKDASSEERAITLVNSGVACWDIERLLKVLPRIQANNAKHEYYLTDAAKLLRDLGERVGVVTTSDPDETHGINNRVDLARAEAILRRRILEQWMREGVTIVDPETTYVDADAVLAPDCRLWPGTMIRGASRIGANCEIGPYTLMEDAIVKSGARVGPFARLRPGTIIEEGARIGNFVETKKAIIGKKSKVSHLSYIGDAEIGDNVNIGAGTITCNYDGFFKYKTTIEDDVFVGSNANLVAPVRLGRGAIVAAGSTITEDVKANALVLARARQMAKNGWAKEFRGKQKRSKHG